MTRASNGLGWVVQQFIHESGWVAVTAPFPSQEEAEAELQAHYPSHMPHRVYEDLDHPTTKRNA